MNRRLSVIERAVWLNARISPINFAVIVRVRGALATAQLEAALSKARQKYPMLAVRVVAGEDGWPCFTSDEVPGLSIRVVERQVDEDWVKEVEHELATPFAWEVGPLVRFVLLRSHERSEIIIVSHHCVGDGLSVAYLARTILRCLGEPDAVVEPLPALPDFEELITSSLKGTLAVKLKMALFKPLLRTMMLLQRLGKKRSPDDGQKAAGEDRFCLLPWSLTESQTSALVARCRDERTTVHAAICAAFLYAYADVRQDGQSRRTVQSPVSVRDRLSVPVGENLGVFIGLVEVPVDCAAGRDLWDVSRDIKQGFDRGMMDDKILLQFLTVRAVMMAQSDEELIAQWGDRAVNYDLSVSNLGRLDLPLQYGPLQLEAFYGPAVNGTKNEQVLGVATVGGQMTFTYVYRTAVMGSATAQRICDRAMHRLAEAVGW